MYFEHIKKLIKYETSFSRLRTQDPQTPGKLHEPSYNITEVKYSQATYTSVIPN